MERRDDDDAVSEPPPRLSTGRSRAAALRGVGGVRALVDALLPGVCVLCTDPSGTAALCGPCLRGLPPLLAACPVCALPRGPGTGPCAPCRRAPPPWRSATATLRYDFPADRLVSRFKFRGDFAAGAALATAMALGPRPPAGDRPWLVPVPLHWSREALRGFNQAIALARDLAAVTGWPLRPLLKRRRRTRPQARLAGASRRDNLAGAFRWRGPPPAGRRVVLVDDVMTTGTTLAECALAMGGADVHLWVATRALPGRDGDPDGDLDGFSPPAAPSVRGRATRR